MPLSLAGQMTLAGAVPLANGAVVALDGAAAAQLPRVAALAAGSARAAGRVTVNLPSIQARVDALVAIANRLTANPFVSVSASGVADIAATLAAELSDLEAYIALAVSLGATLATPGVWVYTGQSTAGALGDELDAEIGGGLPSSGDPDLPVYSVVLIGADAGAIAAMQQVFAS